MDENLELYTWFSLSLSSVGILPAKELTEEALVLTLFPVLFVWVIYFRVYLLTWGKAQGNLLKSLHWSQVAFRSEPKNKEIRRFLKIQACRQEE